MKKLKLRVGKETVLMLGVAKGGEDIELPPTALYCDPLKAERVEAPE